jgi:hypothetical protein
MNKLTIAIVAFFILKATFAHTIVGTPMLEGSIKTEVLVGKIKAKCRMSIDEIGNMMKEDSHGNPAYFVNFELTLSDGFEGKIDFKKKDRLINIFKIADGNTETRDFEYSTQDGSVKVKIDNEGRLLSTKFVYKSIPLNCQF